MTSTLPEPVPAATGNLPPLRSTAAPQRIDALDFVKGALVVFMVIYHSLNYTKYLPLGFKYFSFLPPSFIFITGFLLLQIYAPKLRAGDRTVYKRTFIRGLKLLLLFSLLNLLALPTYIHYVDALRLSFPEFLVNTFVWGNGRLAKFEILLPIAYLLLLAPLLLRVGLNSRATILAFTGLYLGAFWLAERQFGTWENLQLLTAGILGVGIGALPFSSITKAARNWILVLAGFIAYRWASWKYGESLFTQIFGVMATLLLLYSIALGLSPGSRFYQELVRLGKYSLWAYIFQIAFLQASSILFGRSHEAPVIIALLMLSVMVATHASVLLLEWLRRRISIADRSYRLVFQ